MIGKIIYKTELESKEFAEILAWCVSTHRGYLEDRGDYYEVMETLPDSPYPPPTLIERQAWKLAELKFIRDAKEVEPLQTSKGLFDYDDKSRDRLAIARQALMDNEGMESILWTTADNQRVALTVEDFAEINSMAAYRSNSLHIKYNELKVEVNEAQTKEEIEGIVWDD